MVNPTAFILVGHNKSGYPKFWVEKEYYFDSKEHNYQKSDTELADDFLEFIKNRPVRGIYVDPSAQSFIVELNRRGVRGVMEADNDVLKGLHFNIQLLSDGSLKIVKGCEKTIMEFGSYVWDDKSRSLGIDKPKKENDHCFEGDTRIWTKKGSTRIRNIRLGMEVVTPLGYRKVLAKHRHICKTPTVNVVITFDSGKYIEINSTPDHKVFTLNRRFVPISELRGGDVLLSQERYNYSREGAFFGQEDDAGLVHSIGIGSHEDLYLSGIATNFKWERIAKIEIKENRRPKKKIVWNLTVEDVHVYFAEEILALNCLDALRYATTSAFFDDYGSEQTSMKPADWTKLYHKHADYLPQRQDVWGF